MKPKALTDNDYKFAAEELDCEPAIIKAFAEVESSGYGFWQFSDTDWRPKILFEAHWFHKFTNGIYDKSHPNISSPVWNKELYYYGKKEYNRLDEACALNREAGLKSASWGKFQIMGFNYSRCGYRILQDFINDMYHSELGHLNAFIGFILSDIKLLAALRTKDFVTIALRYNGSGNVKTYADRIESAYQQYLSLKDKI